MYKQVKNLIEESKKDFYDMVKEETVTYDSSLDVEQGWHMWIEPKLLYRTKKNFEFRYSNGSGYTGTPSGFEYHLINFDIERKKNITFRDYFILKTPADTTFLIKLVVGSGRMGNWSSLSFGNG